MNPKISVLMPVYNGERYVKEAINSILKQTFKDFELIIIDDGSIDGSVEIIKSYCNDKRIRLIKNEKNLGLKETRNRLVAESKGQYLAMMDCDDVSLPKRFEKQYDFLESNSEYGMVGAWVSIINKNGKSTGEIWKFPSNSDEITASLLFENCFAHSAVIIRKSIFPEDGYRYNTAEDYDLWARISFNNKICNLKEVLILYRIHQNSDSYRQAILTNATQKKDSEIRLNQLVKLGINPTTEELNVHNSISTNNLAGIKNKIDIISIEEWFIKLYHKNVKEKIYDEDAFLNIIKKKWSNVCYNSARLGNWIYFYFKRSFLGRGYKFGVVKEVKFFFKGLLKIGSKMKNKKIAFYTDSPEYGGAEKYLEDIIFEFNKLRYDIYIICAKKETFKYLKYCEKINIIEIKIKNILDIGAFFRILKTFYALSGDIVFINFRNPFSCQFAAIAAFVIFGRNKIIGILHAVDPPNKGKRIGVFLRMLITKWILKNVGKLICPSSYAAKTVIDIYGCKSNNVKLIYNGVKNKKISNDYSKRIVDDYKLFGKKVIICISRLAVGKGINILIAAFAIVKKQISDAMLLIVGTGELFDEMIKMSNDLNLADSIIFAGFQENVQKFLAVSDVVIMPSLSENLPYVLLEAMIQGKAIISTNVGGIPEIINSMDCGVLVQSNNILELANEAIKLLQDEEKRTKLGVNAQKRARELFSKVEMHKKTNLLFKSVMA